MINFSYRFHAASRALKTEVDRGTVGEFYFGRTVWHRRRGIPGSGWFVLKELSGDGPLIDLGVHRLDLALWLMGYPRPVWIMAKTYGYLGQKQAKRDRMKLDVEDLAVGLIQFDNGAILELEASWAAYIKEAEFMETRLLGTKTGMVQRNLNEGYNFQAEIYLEKNGFPYTLSLNSSPYEDSSAILHFVDAILKGRQHMATADEGLVVMKILDALYESDRRGQPLQIE